MATTILRLPAVIRERGRSRSAHYMDIQQGLFTPPVPIGARLVGGPRSSRFLPGAQRPRRLDEAQPMALHVEGQHVAAMRTATRRTRARP